jgi:drug/metabolite transporter (DMT)-like permease
MACLYADWSSVSKGEKGSKMHARTRKLALTEGVAAGTLFGTAAIFIRCLQELDSFSISFWRLIVACLVLVALSTLLRQPLNLSFARRNLNDLVLLSVLLGLHFIFFISAVKDTTILNATVLVNTTPIFSMFVSSIIFKVKPSRFAVVGLTISFLGVCIISYAETTIAGQGSTGVGYFPSLKGDLEAVLAAIVEAFYLNYGRRIRQQTNVLSIMTPIYLLTALVVGVLSLPFSGRFLTFPSNPLFGLFLVGLGILPTAAAHTLYFSSLSNLKSFETATMALLEPIGATILGIGLFQEIPAPLFAFGAVLILIGILFIIGNKSSAST